MARKVLSKLAWARIVVLVIGMVLATEAFWLEPASLAANHYRLVLPAWPAECNGLKVAVLADLHVGSPHNGLDKLDAIVAETNAAKPDIVLLAGDYVIQGVIGGEFITPEKAGIRLRKLRARNGVYAVLGNHDWWLDAQRVARALTNSGITVLEDANQRLKAGRCEVTLVGISDFWEGPHDVDKAMQGADDPVIVFTHNPDVFVEMPRKVALAVAGHTHGGQVRLPVIGAPVIPSNYGQRFAAGRIEEDGQVYFVSTGIGTSILPVRFGVPPEVSVLELVAR